MVDGRERKAIKKGRVSKRGREWRYRKGKGDGERGEREELRAAAPQT